ncbi:MAG: aromatic amino acid lyase [Gaiellaceae bacterium]
MIVLARRADIDLDALLRVAWRGEGVRIGPAALERIGECRRSFLELIDSDPAITVYGVTSGYGDRAAVRLTAEERKQQASRPPVAGASFGEPLPERVTRGIVLARLANFLEGHGAVRPELAEAVAGMLDGGRLPPVPAQGNGGAGEILALGHLFHDLGRRLGLEEKESLALVNGSPCAAALVGDAALEARGRLRLAHEAFALSAEAFRAPLEAYSAELAELWGDEHETAALGALGALLEGSSGERRAYQAPVSYRILPRLLGQAHRAFAEAERAAEISLRSVSDNPVYVPPDGDHPLGRVWSTGGYHNAQAPPALDGLAAAWADLAALAESQMEKLLLDERAAENLRHLIMVEVGWAEEARHAAQRTLLPRGGFGQNDVGAPSFLAWGRERAAGAALDAALAVLSVTASQALWVGEEEPAPPLAGFLAGVRELFPPASEIRPYGDELGRLADAFTTRIFGHLPA